MRFISIIGVELLGAIFILICLILALKFRSEYADKNSVPYVSHFETFDLRHGTLFAFAIIMPPHWHDSCLLSQSDTSRFDTPQFEISHFEILVAKAVTYIRKGEKFQMKKISLEFVKAQLENIRVSKNAEYSSGIAATLIQFIDMENPPEQVTLSIDASRCTNKINAIKELRGLMGFGLKECKDHVELGTPFLTTTDVTKALKVYKTMKQFTDVKVKGSPAMETLFG